MTYTRANVYANGGDFSDPTLLWYARGVAALKSRALADPTAWRFFGAIHGLSTQFWTKWGYLSSSDKMPTKEVSDLFWNQCQHGSWYFLPWHRGYLIALEAMIRAAVIELKGPADWALPYWNYFAPNEFKLPPAFATQDWPDGTGNNPLFVEQRWGPNNDGNVYVDLSEVNLNALTVPDYTGVASGGDPGFGGVDTGFSHGGKVHGDLETQPHDYVHVLVGGADPQTGQYPGLMSYPPTAGLDPIFYLHHANIDRLWEIWLRTATSTGNPKEASWLNGPAGSGGHVFAMPMPPSGAEWIYTPGEMADLSKLDYGYDDLSPASVSPMFADRVETVQNQLDTIGVVKGAAQVTTKKQNVEMVGASEQPLRIAGTNEVRTSVQLNEPARLKMSANLAIDSAAEAPAAQPERVFLNLENVRGMLDAVAFHVFVNGQKAGSIGLFGVTQATATNEEQGGEGLTFVLEVTDIVNALHLENALDTSPLDVSIVPVKHVPEEAQISIGRVSLFRQGR